MTERVLTHAPGLAGIFGRSVVTARLAKPSTLPDTVLLLPGQRTDRDHLTAYQQVCGFDVSDALPHTYPHVVGFPLQAELMAGRDFPLPLAGLVHLENTITVHRALTAHDVLDVRVHARDLRDHPKGRLVDLVTQVDVAGDRVWDGVSTYLQRGRGSADAATPPAAPALPDRPAVARWQLAEDLGRRYAAVSGDVNPIHLYPLTAKAMGFPRHIAHGMWTYARTLAALGRRAGGPATSHVWFRKPVFLPGRVALVVDPGATPLVAGLVAAKDVAKEHLVLTLAPTDEG